MLAANEAEFEHAAAYMRDASVAKKATQQQQLKLYALFKQASTGAYADVCSRMLTFSLCPLQTSYQRHVY